MPYVLIDNPDWEEAAGGWGGLERIEFDFENPEEFNTTLQFEEDEGTWIEFNVTTKIGNRGPNTIRLSIEYRESDNQHLFVDCGYGEDDFIWGTHILTLERGVNSGSSVWNGEEGPGWMIEQIKGSRRKVTTTKLQRDQAKFRKILMAKDKRCAASGESCPTVLEAAHIVPVKCGGQEVLSNGILLRADLHRLYDADPPELQICPDTGKVLSTIDYDGFDFENRKVPDNVLRRIHDALKARN